MMQDLISSKFGNIKQIIRGPISEEQESKLAKKGYYKAWGCQCPRCHVTHIEDNFSDAQIGIDWHKKDCSHIGVITNFKAVPVYILI